MWLFLNIITICISLMTSEVLKSLPPNDNMDFRLEKSNPNKFMDVRSTGEDYPFYTHLFDNEIVKEIDVKKSPFITLKSVRSHNYFTCSCEMEYQYIDLGADYIPRFLYTVSCKGGRCALGFCRPVHYKIPLLRRRKSEEDVNSSSLPSELNENFVKEMKSITIGCQCKP
ncbi:trk [Trypoxylus dichotomus]